MTPNATRTSPSRSGVPNLLTCLRFVLAAAFVALLSFYWHGHSPGYVPLLCAVLFTVAAATDALDGYLARRWNCVSVFGRVMDPFADKVLVLGAFILLAGPGFAWTTPERAPVQVSGVAPWMAIVILSRELLITSLRGMVESRGVSFAATWSGKLKMIAQSVAAPAILALVWLHTRDAEAFSWAVGANAALAWAATIITAWSAIPYITRAVRALRPTATERPTP